MNSEVDYSVFLHLLKKARIESGRTQIEVASCLNKPQSYVSKYESGQRRIDVIEFIEICKAMGVNPCVFLSEIERTLDEPASEIL